MLNNFLKHIKVFSLLSKAITLLCFLLFLNACTDQGCIDADDFGEYESQTIIVESISSSTNCNYDITEKLNDTNYQSSNLISCFTSGQVTVYDTDGNGWSNADQDGEKGCSGFSDETHKNLCIQSCVQECYTKKNSNSFATSSEPNWITNDERSESTNTGVSIMPGSEISIRAVGDVNLGSDQDYGSFYIQSDTNMPHSKTSDWENRFLDLKAGQTLTLKFSGRFNNGSDTIGGGPNSLGQGLESDSQIYNAARRLGIQMIAHPRAYNFDSDATTEKAGSKIVPLVPDPISWECSYGGNISDLVATCGNDSDDGYSANGYLNINDQFAAEVFPVSSLENNINLGVYGGFIRWTGDNLTANNYDPFSAIVPCADLYCDLEGVQTINPNFGKMIDEITSDDGIIVRPPTQEHAYRLSFKTLTQNSNCNLAMPYQVINSEESILEDDTFNISNSQWTEKEISLEGRDSLKLFITEEEFRECSKVIAVKFAKYHDIPIYRSGYVSFLTYGDSTTSQNCTLNGRIINPEGNHLDFAPYSADFYEYDNFTTSPSQDPIDDLIVYNYSGASTASMDWSQKVFVRKGQKIRINPETWNQKFNVAAGVLECGKGMAMRIEERPALLCRGKSTESVNNPNCVQDYDDGTLIGCQAIASECNSDDDTSNYCPNINCQKSVSCDPGDNSAKTNCVLIEDINDCTYSDGYDAISCSQCSDLKYEAATQSPYNIITNVDKCYDLENYKGKVANIPLATGFSSDELSNPDIAKGAVELAGFNGAYGNFASTTIINSDRDNTYNSARFRNSISAISSYSGRMRFFIIDGTDFNGSDGAISSYSDNSSSGSSYNGTNGLKINLSGTLVFSNGQWLQVRLCEDTNDSPCITNDILGPEAIPNQTNVIEIATPTSASQAFDPNIGSSNYRFDDSGNLIRINSPTSLDCNITSHGIETQVGSRFLCHTKYYNSDDPTKLSSNIKKLRLSFKILDPEIANCSTTGNSNYDGIISDNINYDSSDSNNIGTTCSNSEMQDENNPCTKQFYCANKYSNNEGQYNVKIKVKKPQSDGISSMIGAVITPIIRIMDGPKSNCSTYIGYTNNSTQLNGIKRRNNSGKYTNPTAHAGKICPKSDYDNENCSYEYYCDNNEVGQAERVYKLLISDDRYKLIVNVAFVMMFTFYGMGYLMGVSELNHSELISRLLKMSVIYLFIGETGWYWFNSIVVQFFKNGTDYLAFLMASSFDDNPAITQAISKQDYYDKSVIFSSVDQVFNVIFSPAVQNKISALLFASIFGWAYLLIVLYGIMLYVFAVANAVLLYLTAQVFISILFVLGPIFFIFTLFSQTKEMFDNWLKQLIALSLQQIFLLTTLAFFNMLIYEVIKMALGYKICWDDVWTINIIFRVTLLSFWTIASMPPRAGAQSDVGNITNADGIPSLFTILFIWVIASLMNKFIQFMTDLAATISGGLQASALGAGISSQVSQLRKGGLEMAKSEMWKRSGLADKLGAIDKTLFDSGEIAKRAREDRRKQNREDSRAINDMRKAGEKALSDLKKNDTDGYSSKTAEQQEAIRAQTMKEAQEEAAKKLGLSDEKIKELRSMKGVKSEATNLAGYIADTAAQRFRHSWDDGKSSYFKSMDEEDSKSSYSRSEANESMKNKTAEERKKFKESGVEVEKGTMGKMADRLNPIKGMRNIGKSLSSTASSIRNSIVYDEETKEVINDLESQGRIDRMRKGYGSFRPKEDQKLIEAEKKRRRQEKKINKPDASNESLKYLDREEDHLNRMEESKGIRDRFSSYAKSAQNYLSDSTTNIRAKFGDEHSKKRKAEIAQRQENIKKSSITNQIKSTQDAIKNLRSNKAELQNTLENLEADKAILNNDEKKNPLTSPQDIERSAKLKSEREEAKISQEEQFKMVEEKIKEPNANINQIIAEEDILQEKLKNLNAQNDKPAEPSNTKPTGKK